MSSIDVLCNGFHSSDFRKTDLTEIAEEQGEYVQILGEHDVEQ